jgi:hypothetical protein
MASTALTKIAARRRNSIRRGFEDFNHFRFYKILSFAHNANASFFVRKCERNKGHFAQISCEPFASKNNFFNRYNFIFHKEFTTGVTEDTEY